MRGFAYKSPCLCGEYKFANKLFETSKINEISKN